MAFLSLAVQAKGLWGQNGIAPMDRYLSAIHSQLGNLRFVQAPTVFWLIPSSSDGGIVAVALIGALAAGAAFAGLAQGIMLAICFAVYLSFCTGGQDFMSFQWDALLLEIGFLALFVAPWTLGFSFFETQEPWFVVRWMFLLVLFKLMFLSGFVKLESGDSTWRDFSALAYHYWTQPLPNPLAPFLHALPLWFHRVSTALTFALELVAPFLLLWPRMQWLAGVGFLFLSMLILVSGNFAFFNWLTIALCLWCFPNSFWQKIFGDGALAWLQLPVPPAAMPNVGLTGSVSVIMALLTLMSVYWCTRWIWPKAFAEPMTSVLQVVQPFQISNPYGLFANMTTTRPEIVIEGSVDGTNWEEYAFKYKASALDRRPPVVAPHQPRLDWQMWFAALSSPLQLPWFQSFLVRLCENSPEVLGLLGEPRPLGGQAPKFLRVRMYEYTFKTPAEIVQGQGWWNREPVSQVDLQCGSRN